MDLFTVIPEFPVFSSLSFQNGGVAATKNVMMHCDEQALQNEALGQPTPLMGLALRFTAFIVNLVQSFGIGVAC